MAAACRSRATGFGSLPSFPRAGPGTPGGWDTVGRDVSICLGALVSSTGPPRRLRPAAREENKPGWSTPGTAVSPVGPGTATTGAPGGARPPAGDMRRHRR